MKRFKDFIVEGVIDNRTKSPIFDDFLNEIETTMIKDFKMTKEQVRIFIRQYNDILKSDFEQGFTPKEAIASTKKYGKLEK